MVPPVRRFSRQGLLLVEAVLAAVVIAVGLVFISRSLSSQLKALRSVEEYDTLASLAQGKLRELEAKLLARSLGEQDRQGVFEAPYAGYRWAVSARVREEPRDPTGDPLMKDVMLSVERAEPPPFAFQLTAVWPASWVPETWR